MDKRLIWYPGSLPLTHHWQSFQIATATRLLANLFRLGIKAADKIARQPNPMVVYLISVSANDLCLEC